MESEKLLNGRVSSESFEDLDLGHHIRTRRSRRARIGKWALRILVSWLTLWSIFNISTKLWKTFHKPQRVSCACGSSFAEARALNCRFDSLASAWLRPECIDEDLTAEFNRAGPGPDGSWTYYTDYDKTGTYTLDQIASLADTGIYYYNTQAWHLAHCTFNWRKAIRSKWTGVVMEARSDTEEHVDHCEAMFKSRLPLDYVGVVSAITFDADWAGLKHEMHANEGSMHKDMHTMHNMHDMHSMHTMHDEDSKSMHGEMHGDMHGEMHPEGAMHKSMHSDEMHPEGNMHPSSDMHPSVDMHPSTDMHPSAEMHPSENMHPSTDMHPSENMHPSSVDMHPNMHPSGDMHPGNMHPSADMHPSAAMHPGNMHPSSEMHPSPEMHPGNMHPSADMHPTELA